MTTRWETFFFSIAAEIPSSWSDEVSSLSVIKGELGLPSVHSPSASLSLCLCCTRFVSAPLKPTLRLFTPPSLLLPRRKPTMSGITKALLLLAVLLCVCSAQCKSLFSPCLIFVSRDHGQTSSLLSSFRPFITKMPVQRHSRLEGHHE